MSSKIGPETEFLVQLSQSGIEALGGCGMPPLPFLGDTVGHIANRSQIYRIMERSRHSYSVQLRRANINDFFAGTPVLVDRLSNEDEGVSIL